MLVKKYFAVFMLLAFSISTGCSINPLHHEQAVLSPVTPIHRDLLDLPPPSGMITASVYHFRDMTGQYKIAPHSNLSSAVSQGATSILVEAMKDSGWFLPVEREGLQDLLTERKIIRATQGNANKDLPDLLPSAILLEGGVVGYDTNIKTGGVGAKYFGISASMEYRVDQVTVSLRAVDVRDGRVLTSILTSKKIYSHQLNSGFFRFVSDDRLAQAELGFTTNDPVLTALRETIESALVHLIVEGVIDGIWTLRSANDIENRVIASYVSCDKFLRGATLLPPYVEPRKRCK